MTSGKKKYQWTALTLLVMLAINILIPSTLMAVNLYCQGTNPDASAVGKSIECCDELKLSSSSEISDDQKLVNYCTFERTCKQEISDSFTEHQGVLPAEKHVHAAPVVPIYFNPTQDSSVFSYTSLGTSFSYSSPPIFLLNSTFLN